MREPLYTQGVIWVNTILNRIDTRAIVLRYEGSCMVSRTKIPSNTHTLLVVKEDDTRPTLVKPTRTYKTVNAISCGHHSTDKNMS